MGHWDRREFPTRKGADGRVGIRRGGKEATVRGVPKQALSQVDGFILVVLRLRGVAGLDSE